MSASGRSGGAAGTAVPLRLELLGVSVSVSMEAGSLRDGLEHAYRAFVLPPTDKPADLELELRRTAQGAELDTPDGCFPAPRGSEATLYFVLPMPVLKRATEHLVLHAGVVASGERALVVCAPSGVGKSTLTLALVEAGYGFLSDELAPLRRKDLRVDPFPRAVGLREGAARLFPALDALGGPVTREPDGTMKRLVDLGERVPAVPDGGLEVSHVLLLAPQAADASTDSRYMELTLSELSPGLESDLAAVPGVQEVVRLGRKGPPVFRLAMDPRARVAAALDRVVEQHGLLLTRAVPAATALPDFTAEPTIERLSPTEGSLELARHLQNGVQSQLLEREYGSSLARLVFDLAGLGSRAVFFRMVVGRMDRMLEQVRAFLEGKS